MNVYVSMGNFNVRNCTEYAKNIRNILDNRGVVAREFYLHYLWEKLRERLRILNLVGIKLRINVLKLNGERGEIELVWRQRDETQDWLYFNSNISRVARSSEIHEGPRIHCWPLD